MKIVLGIILLIVVLAALVMYIVFVMNAHDLVYCGDITGTDGDGKKFVTRVYVDDLSANETLVEIVNTMNNNTSTGSITAAELTEILAQYQNVIYAPVFTFKVDKYDTNTFVLTGSAYNGLNSDGEPVTPEFYYRNMTLSSAVSNGEILAAQNVYFQETDENGDAKFIERNNIVEPVILDEGKGAAFSLGKNCDSFRLVFTGIDGLDPSVTIMFTYEVVAQNPLNFTRIKDGVMRVNIKVDYDSVGRLMPKLEVERVYKVEEE